MEQQGGGERYEELLRPHEWDRRFVERRRYDVKMLWAKHHQILRQVVLGRKNTEIAESIGCTPQTVSNVRNSEMARHVINGHMEAIDADVRGMAARIQEFVPVALQLLEETIAGHNDASLALRLKYADKHLGRAGLGEVRKIQAMHGHLTRADIEELKARAEGEQMKKVGG